MIATTQRLQPRSADVASKVMDGEAIIIDLSTGVYYSLDRAGGLVWDQVVATRSVGEIVAAVTSHYDVSATRAQADVERLLGELLHEDLIVPLDGGAIAVSGTIAPREARAAYEPPALNIYRDMGDLLALDPPTPGLDTPWNDPDASRP